jgi:fibronectin type 3 domain-containing protein
MASIRRESRFLWMGLMAMALFVGGCNSDAEEAVAPIVDTVPPAIPEGIAAGVTGGGAVSLTWDANTVDSDLLGYIVYRSESALVGFRPLTTQPVGSNTWSDAHVQAGRTYHYAVAARDVSRNESARSATFIVTVPNTRDPGGIDQNH